MAQLRRAHGQFLEQDTVVLVIGPETADKFVEYFKQNDLPFAGLPDPKHRVLKLFGQEVNLFKLGRMPAQVVVDKQGVVRFAHYGQSMSDIPGNKKLLALLKALNAEAMPVDPDFDRQR
jgi:peroxiredoxin